MRIERFIMWFVLGVLLVGCQSKKVEVITSADIDNKVTLSGDQSVTTIETEQGTLEVATQEDTFVVLPLSYPVQILPVYDEDHLDMALDNGDSGYSLHGYSLDPLEKVIAYYKEALEDAKVLMEQNEEDLYTNMGEKEMHTYTVMVEPSELSAYPTAFTLILVPSEEAMTGESDVAQEDGGMEDKDATSRDHGPEMDYVVVDGVDFPDTYPSDQLPVYPYGHTEIVSTMGQGDQQIIAIRTEDPTPAVQTYYEEALKGSENYSTMLMDSTTIYAGTIDGVSFTVYVMANDGSVGEDISFRSLIQVAYTLNVP